MKGDFSRGHEPDTKKSHSRLWTLIIVIAVIAVGAGYLFTLGEHPAEESSGGGANEIKMTDTSDKEEGATSEPKTGESDFMNDDIPAGSEDGTGDLMEEDLPAPDERNGGIDEDEEVNEKEEAAQSSQTHTVTYSDSGFSPSTLTIKVGDTVTWRNAGGPDMWVASAFHPTHTAYDGTSLTEHCTSPNDTTFDQCQSGDSYSFTFTKEGEWDYHNHERASHRGTVVVE